MGVAPKLTPEAVEIIMALRGPGGARWETGGDENAVNLRDGGTAGDPREWMRQGRTYPYFPSHWHVLPRDHLILLTNPRTHCYAYFRHTYPVGQSNAHTGARVHVRRPRTHTHPRAGGDSIHNTNARARFHRPIAYAGAHGRSRVSAAL